ncbi:MAG: PKD domain-containing protein, partial [Bacteroidales bacterium]|nr:PKD domain-containing protein [Bacteroidales bacterium]
MRNFISFIAITILLTLSINPSNAQGLSVKVITPNNKTDFCANQPITLVAQTDLVTDEEINFKWEGDLSIVEKNLGNILILKPNSKGIYTFTVFLKDNEGNEASSSVTINVNPIFKPILKLKNNKVEIETKGNFSGC